MSVLNSPHYSVLKTLPSLGIGLFGLVGIFGVLMGPLGGRVLDRLVLWYGSLISELVFLLVLCIQLGAGGINIGAVVVVAFGIDVFNQMIQVSVTTRILGYVKVVYLIFSKKTLLMLPQNFCRCPIPFERRCYPLCEHF